MFDSCGKERKILMIRVEHGRLETESAWMYGTMQISERSQQKPWELERGADVTTPEERV